MTWYAVRIYDRMYLQTTIENVSKRALLINNDILDLLKYSSSYGPLDSLCKTTGKAVSTRLTVVLSSGKVIGDSEADPDTMENHANRPEILRAFTGVNGVQQRFSSTLGQRMLYIAVPIKSDNKIIAVLRLSVPLQNIQDHEGLFYIRMAAASFLALLILAIASYFISRRLSKPIQIMKAGAQRFASGDFQFKLQVNPGEELSDLAHSLNTMASSLDERIKMITHQRNELDAILNGMSEGVVAIDSKERVVSMNRAALKLLGLNDSSVNGKWLHEIIRNSDLRNFLTELFSGQQLSETSFSLTVGAGVRYLQVHGSVLNKQGGTASGAVLVINDITRLRHLENVRKDFVANVSHELRTPLTSIKGFVETIQNGGYDLPPDVGHFLEIISTKTDRLCSIVDDILSLSSIERDHEHKEISFSLMDVDTVIEDAIRTCDSKAKAKGISINHLHNSEINARINAQLLEQAIVNLIDNAVKYSNGGGIDVSAFQENNEVVILVSDNGIGIPEEHIGRIFERFYRVDKARSRKLGGTGLGLSIVKNIAVAHGGRVSVQSELNKGSVFKIYIPINAR